VHLKIDLIQKTFAKLRISGITVTPSVADNVKALDILELMASDLQDYEGININYNFQDVPDLNSFSNIPRFAQSCFITYLAVLLIPEYNKKVPAELHSLAAQHLERLVTRFALDNLRDVPYPSRMPVGRSNELFFGNGINQDFFVESAFPPNDGKIEQLIIGDTNDYTEHYDSYLKEEELIVSFVITADPGLSVLSSELVGADINYRIKALNFSTAESFQQLKIIVVTDSGRQITRLIDFKLISNQTIGS